jgi:cytochrome oxidase Cu insertion factor (SCO1/SenC/PrrC family)
MTSGLKTEKTFAHAALALVFVLAVFAAALAAFSVEAAARPVNPATVQRARARASASTKRAQLYSCPMHPKVTSASAGKCPQCKMALVKRAESPDAGAAADASGKTATDAAATKGTEETSAAIPNTTVFDQDGKRLNFYSDLVQGRTVVINFVFTTCNGVCPTLTARFRQLQQQLSERSSDVRLISISVDPVTDVPARLKEYAERFHADAGWTFVTGSKPEIDALLRALGSGVSNKTDHTNTALIVNDSARSRTRVSALASTSALADLAVEVAGRGARALEGKARGGAASEREGLAETSASYFPNHVLLTQDDKPVRFYDDLLKGKVVLINFMFTECKGVCSPMTANMAKVQSYLGERVGRDVVMLSITVDPANDTPAVLKEYSAKFKAKPGWYFLSGKKENVDWVLYKLGGYAAERTEHSSVLILGNEATGQWMKISAMTNPSEIAAAVVKLTGGGEQQSSR